MKVYCVLQRFQLNMYQCEWILHRVFSTEEAAEKFCNDKVDHEDWVWQAYTLE